MSAELDPLEQHLVDELRALAPPERAAEIPAEAAHAWRAQIESRAIDHAARWLQAQKLGFYTIGSAGHESNALVALALSPTDPALLHYRSGGFYLARAAQAGRDGVWDVLLGMAAAVEEPMAGGRHKVFGHHDLAVIPQTSTIASHLPRAVGIAFAIERARELGVPSAWPRDAVVVCSFGDASLNHATAQSALNAAAHFAYRGERLPLLFVCEDNGFGISVPTPEGWVEQALHGRPELAVERVGGDDPAALLATAKELAEWVRENRHPAVLHLRTVRFLSHAGADLETAYRSGPDIRADFARDPLLATGRWLVSSGAVTRGRAGGRVPRRAGPDPRPRARGEQAPPDGDRRGGDAPPRAARSLRRGRARGRSRQRRDRRAADARAGDRRRARRRPRGSPRGARFR